MKTWILALMMTVGLSATAQHRGDRQEPLKPEQKAELQSKKIRLALDLNEKQQKDIQKLFTERNKKTADFQAEAKANREVGKKPTANERFEMKNRMLDGKIAMKEEMKKILTADQFEKWEKLREHRKENFNKGHKIRKREGKR